MEKHRAEIQTTEAGEKPPLDRSPASIERHYRFGEGTEGLSREEEKRRARDEASYISHDGRARTRTTFWPSDAPTTGPLRSDGKRTSWTRLAKWNDGMWTTGREARNNAANQQRWVKIACTQLELSAQQQQRVARITDELDMSHMANYPSEVVILTIVSLVANEGGRFIRDEKKFREFTLALDTTLKDIRSCRRLVKEKTEL